jgi:hypothetical protein
MAPQEVGSKGVQAARTVWFHMCATLDGSIDPVRSWALSEVVLSIALRTPIMTS